MLDVFFFFFFLSDKKELVKNHAFLERSFRTVGETASWTVVFSLAQIKLFFIIIIVFIIIIDWLLMISVTKTYPQALPKGSWDGHHLFPGKNYCLMLTSHPSLPWTEICQGFSAKIKTCGGKLEWSATQQVEFHLLLKWRLLWEGRWLISWWLSCQSSVSLSYFCTKHICFSPSLYPSRGIGEMTYLREAGWVEDQRECCCVCACVRERESERESWEGHWVLGFRTRR